MTEILSVSVDKRDKEFMKSNGLSPSRLLRSKIYELRDGMTTKEIEQQNERLILRISKFMKYMHKRGLINDFQEESKRL